MSDTMKEYLAFFLLLGGVATGGYVYGTPGSQLIPAALCGVFLMLFIKVVRS